MLDLFSWIIDDFDYSYGLFIVFQLKGKISQN